MALYGRGNSGPMDALYGAFGNPTQSDRQRLYDQQTGLLGSQINHAQADAQRQAMGAAATAGASGNPFLAGRVGAHEAGDAAARVQSAGLVQRQQLAAGQMQQELQARQHQGQWAQNQIGGLLGAGGQVLGMAIPAFGAARGVAGATGVAGALGGSGNPIGSMLGSALGGGQGAQPAPPQMAAPQAPTPQMGIGAGGFQTAGFGAPPGMRWDPMTNQWVAA